MRTRKINKRRGVHAQVARASLLGMTLTFGFGAQADEYHYNNIVVGDRASGMGGAYTAVSDDPAGLYYNPAGIVYGAANNLSASVNAYHRNYTEYKNVLGGNGWKRTSASLLPNFFGVTQTVGRGTVGFSYAVPDSILEDQDQSFSNIPGTLSDGTSVTIEEFIINFSHKDETYNIGPSYALKLGKTLSAGGTLYIHRRERDSTFNQYLDLNTGGFQWLNTYYETAETGVKPVLGLMWAPVDKVSIGVALSKVSLFSSRTLSQTTCQGVDCAFERRVVRSDEKRELPYVLNFGAAYFPSSALLVSMDVSYYTETDDNFQDKDAVLNVAFGTEYYFTSQWAMRLGFFTDHANTPEVAVGETNQPEHIDLYNGSFSVSRFAGNSTTTFGLAYGAGSGETQLFGGSTSIQQVDRQTFTVFLSASYSY